MRFRGSLAVLVLAVCASTVFAQGIIVPDERPNLPRMIPLPVVKSQAVEVRIEGAAAVTTVDQVFLNRWTAPVEGVYLFPLPPGAMVSEFYLWIEGRKVKGELLAKEEAARIYRDIVRRMQDPALLEWSEFNLFKASVFPIPANGERRIEMKYTQTLPANGGLYHYLYPLKGRGKTYLQPIESFSLAVKLRAPQPIASVYSPTHIVDIQRGGEREASIGLEMKNYTPENDFQLYFGLSDKEFGLSFASWREVGEADGYFMLLLAPRLGLERQRATAKDIVFVLDTSGSMLDDDKIGQALRALTFGLATLRPDDRFGLITFATEVRPFRDQLVPAAPANVEAAKNFLKDASATGATNINDALKTALAMIGGGERPRYVIFLTDGLPTHVERDPGVIIKRAGEWAPPGVRIFNWGVGYDVDTRLLDTIATNHGGASEYVKPREDMELKLGTFFEKISHPVLTGLSLSIEGLNTKDRYPVKLPDLFKGSQITLFGRYSGSGSGSAVLTGTIDGERRTFRYPIQAQPLEKGDFIAQLWATRKVGFLLDEIRLHGENAELKDEVIRLAKKYGLVTPYTSYLVTEPEMDLPRPQPMPADNNQPGRPPRELFEARAEAPASTSGKEAVQYSTAVKKLKDEETAAGGSSAAVKRIAGKTFVWTGGEWRDDSFTEKLKVTEVTFNSDAWFALLKKDPNMSKWLALGSRVLVVHQGVAWRVVE